MDTVTQDRQDTRLLFRMEGRLTELVTLGLFPEGFRMVNSFEGDIVTGEPAGARVIGTDHFTIRPDGVGIIEARELVSTDEYQTSAEVHGYATPPAGLQLPSLDVLLDPNFTWPDAWFTIDAFALYRTAAPGLVHLNRTAVSHRGLVNMGTTELIIEGRAVTAEPS